jgi:glycerol-3-phosphate acyltransferase PlsY
MMLAITVISSMGYLPDYGPLSMMISKIWKGNDRLDYGSKSAGFTNVCRAFRTLPALIVLGMDIPNGTFWEDG